MEDDRSLVNRILAGDEQAFGELVKKYQRLVFVTAYRLVKSSGDAEDLSQDVFLEVFRSIEHLRNEEDLSGWIYKIALNKSLSLLRKRNPIKSAKSIHLEAHSAEAEKVHGREHAHSAHMALEQEETRKIVFLAVDQLPENQKKAILLHKFEQLSQKEICEKMGISLVSVESLIYRAKTNLRKSLLNYFKQS